MQFEIFEDAAALHLDDFAFVAHKIVDGEIFFERIIDAVKPALLESRKIERGFAQGFAWNGASIDATSAHVLGALNDGNAFAKVGGLGAGLFSGGATADHDQVKILAARHTRLPGMPL